MFAGASPPHSSSEPETEPSRGRKRWEIEEVIEVAKEESQEDWDQRSEEARVRARARTCLATGGLSRDLSERR
jgi:hypothetical protein